MDHRRLRLHGSRYKDYEKQRLVCDQALKEPKAAQLLRLGLHGDSADIFNYRLGHPIGLDGV